VACKRPPPRQLRHRHCPWLPRTKRFQLPADGWRPCCFPWLLLPQRELPADNGCLARSYS
jgi:hypothetical protein